MIKGLKRIDGATVRLVLKEIITLPRFIYGLNILLCAGLLWETASFIARVVELELLHVPPKVARYLPADASHSDKTRVFGEFEEITKYNIFDVEVRSASNTVLMNEPLVTSASLTSLIKNWQLTGVYAGPRTYCFIQNKTTKLEDMFGIGDLVFKTQIKVFKIIADSATPKVVLKKGDEVAVLEYHKDRMPQGVLRSRPPQQAIVPTKIERNQYSSDGVTFQISSAEVGHHLNNFSQLLNQARVIPYFKNGQSAGYKIKAIDKGSLYEKLGLVNDDIIQEINGEPIDSPEKAFQLLKLLRNEREISVSLTRGGQRKNLTYYIE